MADTLDRRSDHGHFTSIPWCARHLRGSRIITQSPECRLQKLNGEDSLYSETLKSQTTIMAMLQVYEEPPSPTDRVNSGKAFLTLGPGLAGHAGVCHGGIVVTILDEVMGFLISLNQKRGHTPEVPYMTAYLNTKFFKPVPTCATILAQTKIIKLEGRKFLAEAWIEDSNGIVLARAEALFLAIKSVL
ncbi:HotDog domain-containing protein [Daldinia caldariorum]|uniref:HotDog domain-containing protein n=1 Tax=Daldinia caldariorum TaxID=326644 RepID=UPI002007A87A|nr:HotDog domain-containing protein [Daldinia caldariorum]KAI1469881.1 HotDog domain-containing protein [Daldinia caldariorum]